MALPRLSAPVLAESLPCMWAQDRDSLTETAVARLLHGMSTRAYGETLDGMKELADKGVSRSRISARFGQAMRQRLQERLRERLDPRSFVALVVDGVRGQG